MLNELKACCAATRTFVHESIYDEFVKRAGALAASKKVGDPFDEKSDITSLVDETQFKKVLGYIQSGKNEGARVVAGGDRCGNKGTQLFFLSRSFCFLCQNVKRIIDCASLSTLVF